MMNEEYERRPTGKERRARLEMERRWAVGEGLVSCGAPLKESGFCVNKAGLGTVHEGYGRCRFHGGNSERENRIGAWMMARRFGDELDVTPWDALLVVLRRAAAKAQWYAERLSELGDVDEAALLPGGAHHDLVREAERADLVLARHAKMALDAGVAEALVQSVTGQATLIARVLNAAVLSEELGLTDEQVATARRLMRQELRAIEAVTGGEPLDGDTVDGGVTM